MKRTVVMLVFVLAMTLIGGSALAARPAGIAGGRPAWAGTPGGPGIGGGDVTPAGDFWGVYDGW